MKSKFSITTSLAIVSILGFTAILTQSLFNINIDPWINGLLFVIIGGSLFLIGSFWTTVNFKDGLNRDETAHIMLTIVGLLSIIVGLIELPISFLSNINLPAFDGIKGVIALFAIIFISIEGFFIHK